MQFGKPGKRGWIKLKKKLKGECAPRKVSPSYAYSQASWICGRYMKDPSASEEDKLAYLDFMIDVCRREIQATAVLDIMHEKYSDAGRSDLIAFDFPEECVDSEGNKHTIKTDEVREVDFAKDFVICKVQETGKLQKALSTIRRFGFQYEENHNNYFAYYYPEIDVCYVYNGNHHAEAARYYKSGYMQAKVRRLTPLFPHVKTDGSCWFNVHTGEKMEKIQDFRVAVLYELARMKAERTQK